MVIAQKFVSQFITSYSHPSEPTQQLRYSQYFSHFIPWFQTSNPTFITQKNTRWNLYCNKNKMKAQKNENILFLSDSLLLSLKISVSMDTFESNIWRIQYLQCLGHTGGSMTHDKMERVPINLGSLWPAWLDPLWADNSQYWGGPLSNTYHKIYGENYTNRNKLYHCSSHCYPRQWLIENFNWTWAGSCNSAFLLD